MKVIVVENTALWGEAIAQLVSDAVAEAHVSIATDVRAHRDADAIVGRFGGDRPAHPARSIVVDIHQAPTTDPLGWLHRAVSGALDDDEPTPTKPAWTAPTLAPVAPTERELRVLRATAAGGSTSEIAAELGISSTTVASHRRRLYQKWGIHSAAEAVSLARLRGFLHDDEPMPATTRPRR